MRCSRDQMKKRAAQAALDLIKPNMILGIGTGSTVDLFIEQLPAVHPKIDGVVASSISTAQKLKTLNFKLFNLNEITSLDLYIDGADQINNLGQMIKGGHGALTGEKIVASASKKFVCIADITKKVDYFDRHTVVAIEVLEIARSLIARKLVQQGAYPVYREHCITDQGNAILDVREIDLTDPLKAEQELNQLAGVVCNGIFANNPANILLLGDEDTVKEIVY